MADNTSCEGINFIREKEFEYNLRNLTDLQIETVIELYEDHKRDKRIVEEDEGNRIASEEALYVRTKIIERKLEHCRSLTPRQVDTILELYREIQPKKKSVGSLSLDIDCTETIKGLKSIQREAKKSTASLKELSNEQTKEIKIFTHEETKEILNQLKDTPTYANADSLLVIKLDEMGSVPKVFYKGEEVSNKTNVGFNWCTANDKHPGRQVISIDYYNEYGVRKNIHESKGLRSEHGDQS